MSRTERLSKGIRLPEASPDNESLEHFERFCWTLRVPDTGERFRLQEWQLGPLEDFFAGGSDAVFPTQLWEWPTGQGKSTLNGALVLHHGTYVVPRPRVFVIGGEFVHARNTTDAAAGFIYESRRRGGLLGAWWESQEHAGGRLIPLWVDDPDLGIFARSAGRAVERKGGSSVEGKDPTLIIVEELHRHADGGAAVSTLITKTVKAASRGRTVKVLIGSTAGTDRDSYLGRLEAQLLDEDGGASVEAEKRPKEYYKRCISSDEETVGHIWAVPESISPPAGEDEELLTEFLEHVKQANPAEWITIRALKRIWKALSRVGRWQFLRQNCNQWVAAGFGAIDRGQWWSLKREGLQIPAGKGHKVYVGLDRAHKWDSTALVPVWVPPKGVPVVSGAIILDSPRGQGRRRTRDVGMILEVMAERWPDMVVVFDRAQGGGDVAEELEEQHGVTIIDHSQGAPFDLASMRLAEAVEGSKLVHDGDPELSRQVLNAVMKPTSAGRRWRGEAPDDETRVDGFDALAMAHNMALAPLDAKPRLEGDPGDFRIQQL